MLAKVRRDHQSYNAVLYNQITFQSLFGSSGDISAQSLIEDSGFIEERDISLYYYSNYLNTVLKYVSK